MISNKHADPFSLLQIYFSTCSNLPNEIVKLNYLFLKSTMYLVLKEYNFINFNIFKEPYEAAQYGSFPLKFPIWRMAKQSRIFPSLLVACIQITAWLAKR